MSASGEWLNIIGNSTPASFFVWAGKEPNGLDGSVKATDLCLLISLSGQVVDRDCSRKRSALCQLNDIPVVTETTPQAKWTYFGGTVAVNNDTYYKKVQDFACFSVRCEDLTENVIIEYEVIDELLGFGDSDRKCQQKGGRLIHDLETFTEDDYAIMTAKYPESAETLRLWMGISILLTPSMTRSISNPGH